MSTVVRRMKKEYLVLLCHSLTHSLSPTPQYSIIPLLGIYVPPKVPTYVPEVPTVDTLHTEPSATRSYIYIYLST